MDFDAELARIKETEEAAEKKFERTMQMIEYLRKQEEEKQKLMDRVAEQSAEIRDLTNRIPELVGTITPSPKQLQSGSTPAEPMEAAKSGSDEKH